LPVFYSALCVVKCVFQKPGGVGGGPKRERERREKGENEVKSVLWERKKGEMMV